MVNPKLKRITTELASHAPFTAIGAVSGIIIMAIMVLSQVPARASEIVFLTLHPLHVVLSAIVTTSFYRLYGRNRLWAAILVGYTGAVGIATLHDAISPFLGGVLLGISIEFHIPFIEEWWLVNPAAFLGIAIGYIKPTTKIPHAAHVLVSTWASLFYFTAFGIADWIPLLPFVLLFLFLAVWILCCFSDIVYPLLFSIGHDHEHSEIEREL